MRQGCSFVIVGFMASGKSTLVKKLSGMTELREYGFYDLDDIIEEAESKKVSEIINKNGLKNFRDLELQYLIEHFSKSTRPTIMSLGGGALNEKTSSYLSGIKHLKLIWVKAPFETCLSRIRLGGDERPLNKLKDFELKALYLERQEYYKKADIIWSGDIEELLGKMTSSTI